MLVWGFLADVLTVLADTHTAGKDSGGRSAPSPATVKDVVCQVTTSLCCFIVLTIKNSGKKICHSIIFAR